MKGADCFAQSRFIEGRALTKTAAISEPGKLLLTNTKARTFAAKRTSVSLLR
jgi:hypothetical protein